MSETLPQPKLPTLIGLTPDAICAAIAGLGEQPYRGKQIAKWLYEKKCADLARMTDLAKPLREKLASQFSFQTARIAATDHDQENTTKLALRFPDGAIIESVLMFEDNRGPDDDERRTLCVSTQAGCAMGCRFCASGQKGLKRNLTTAEILEQFYAAAAAMKPGEWLTNVVFMGMGEPLHNWENFIGALRAITSPWGFNMSPRRITVSTVGMAPRIHELAKLDIPVHLAVSLHAPNDTVRDELIPTNKAFGGIVSILDAARDYYRETRRQVTFEYTLVRGINDRQEHARELAKLVQSRLPGSNINLIPMNPVDGSGLKTPDTAAVEVFAEILTHAGLSVHTRKKKGRSINAACGQLRLRVEEDMARA